MSSSAALQTVTRVFTATAGQVIETAFTVPPPASGVSAATILQAPHESPAHYNPANPFVIFCIQAGLIICLSRALGWALGKLNQPKVIAEVVAGIVLGPSIMGRIPGFSAQIFPAPTLPYLNLVATIGLVLFLFLVGMECVVSLCPRRR
jgi:hypothetical protein